MNIAILFESSGIVRDAFAARGHNAWSMDLKPSERPGGQHLEGDVRDVIDTPGVAWDLIIAHPPCTYLSASGLHWNSRTGGAERSQKTAEALALVRWVFSLPCARLAVENPVGRIGTAIRPADQYIQPYEFGHNASKRTGLWLKGLPRLQSTARVAGRWVTTSTGRSVERWSNQTDSGQNRLSPSARRATERSRTYAGIAAAMADQWGNV